MKRFNITVNGKAYDVAVEEVGGSAPAAGRGTPVKGPMPGNILDVKVNVGDTVSVGQVLVVLEAMKMENDIVANAAGKVTSITVKKGDTVNSDDVIATIA